MDIYQFEVILKAKKEIAKNTWEITFTHTHDDFNFNAGQYIWVITDSGRRAFSISSGSNNPKELQIIFRGNNQSVYKVDLLSLKEGSLIKIIGPLGSLGSFEDRESFVFVAGGVGIAPFISIFEDIKRIKPKVRINLLFGNRNKEEEFYRERLEEYKKSIPGFEFISVIGEIKVADLDKSRAGLNNPLFVVIGSQLMVDGVAKNLGQLGVSSDNVVYEENYPTFANSLTKQALGGKSVFSSAVAQSVQHVIITDANGKIVYANSAAENITGYTFAEMEGQTPRLWGGLMGEEFSQQLWRTVKKEKKSFKGEIINRRKNGDLYTVIGTISPILDERENLMGFLGMEEDITIRKKIENELMRKNKNLEKMNKLMIGRELKMVDLKKRIKKYESN